MPDPRDPRRAEREAEARRRYTEGIAEAPPVELDAATRALAVAECTLCDDDGYRGAVVCDHREHSTPEARQAAKDALRAALAKGAS